MFGHKITQLSHRIDKKNVTDINFRMDPTTLKKIHPRIYNKSIETEKEREWRLHIEKFNQSVFNIVMLNNGHKNYNSRTY